MTDSRPPSVSMGAIVRGTFIGPVPAVYTPQATFEATCTDWEAFDVARLWHSVDGEDDPDAWAQVNGWKVLSEVVADHHDRLLHLRGMLAVAWDPASSPAAAAFLQVVDGLLKALREDAYANMSTAYGLHGVLESLKSAKERLEPIKRDWDNVTTDFWPEWWDSAAAELNEQARTVMIETDQAVRDHRSKIMIPAALTMVTYGWDAEPVTSSPTPEAGWQSGSKTHTSAVHRQRDEAVPTTQPSPSNGPVLTGSTLGPSMLPIPPGNPHVPGGGAYVLPQPGAGVGGYVLPMPGSQGTAGLSMIEGGSTRGAMGMMPMAAGGIGRGGGIASRAGKKADVEWQTRVGGPPIIGSTHPHQEREADDVFTTWFNETATPWADEGMQVRIDRRAANIDPNS